MKNNEEIKTEIPYGYCHCGCGQKTKLATRTNKNRNIIKGEPTKYVNAGHKNKKTICVNGHLFPERYPDGNCKMCVKENLIKWRANNPEKRKLQDKRKWLKNGSEYQKLYRSSNPEKIKQFYKNPVINLSESYIAKTLKISVNDVPQEVLEIKRLTIQLKRSLKCQM